MPDKTEIAGETKSIRLTSSRWDVFEYLSYVKYRMHFVLIPMLICTLAMAVYVFFIASEKYEATAQLYVVNSRDSAINLSDLQIGSYLTSDYQYVFETWEINQLVINNLKLPYSVEEMRDMLNVENPSNTRILKISFISENAKEAALVANEYAEVASVYISEQMLTSKPSIISTALEPCDPVRPRKVLLLGSAFLLSALGALWVMFLVFLFDDRIKTAADLKRVTSVEPLAIIPATRLMKIGNTKGR